MRSPGFGGGLPENGVNPSLEPPGAASCRARFREALPQSRATSGALARLSRCRGGADSRCGRSAYAGGEGLRSTQTGLTRYIEKRPGAEAESLALATLGRGFSYCGARTGQRHARSAITHRDLTCGIHFSISFCPADRTMSYRAYFVTGTRSRSPPLSGCRRSFDWPLPRCGQRTAEQPDSRRFGARINPVVGPGR